jgi:hypothetical protein
MSPFAPGAPVSPQALPPRPAEPPVGLQRKKGRGTLITISVFIGLVFIVGVSQVVHYFVSRALLQPATGTPLFVANFTNNDQQWPVGSGGDAFSSEIKDGRLVLKQSSSDRFFRVALPDQQTYDNFRLDMTCLFLQGSTRNSLGLELRRPDDAPDHAIRGYVFEFNSRGDYDIIKVLPPDPGSQKISKAVVLKGGAIPRTFEQGQPIALTVIAKGSTLAFYLNSDFVVVFDDTTYTTGSISIVLDNQSDSQPMEAAVQSLTIYPAPDQIPTPAYSM